MALPLSTLEGFVLSRADGTASVEDIALMVGVDVDTLLSILGRLADLGAVRLPWVVSQPTAAAGAGPPRVPQAQATIYDHPAQPPAYDPRELDAPGELDPLAKRRILNAYHSLEGRTLYELLGVANSADRSEIRTAYFELSKRFHPDAFFGRELAGFRGKTEKVFKRLTEAYEVLGRKKRRREYDDYLAATQRTSVTQRAIRAAHVEASELRASSGPHPGPAAADSTTAAHPSQVSSVATQAQDPAEQVPKAPRLPREHASPRPAPTVEERRARAAERLRRRLDSAPPGRRPPTRRRPPGAARPNAPVSSRRPPAPQGPGQTQPPESARARRDSAIEGLRRSLGDSARVAGASARLARYVTMARQAEAAGDPLSAVNALQLALAMAEDDEQLRADYERLSRAVADDLANNFEKQAQYEEKVNNWSAAARSWKRVADSRPESPVPASKVANALLRSGGDLHQAKKYAQKAVSLEPTNADSVVLLARVLLAAGLKLNAQRELEKALNLDPRHEMAKNLLGEVK